MKTNHFLNCIIGFVSGFCNTFEPSKTYRQQRNGGNRYIYRTVFTCPLTLLLIKDLRKKTKMYVLAVGNKGHVFKTNKKTKQKTRHMVKLLYLGLDRITSITAKKKKRSKKQFGMIVQFASISHCITQ